MQIDGCPARLGPIAIVVMGVSGSGKSTLGPLLAQRLACPYLEGDDFHDAAAVAKMAGGAPLSDDDRWPWLDRLGRAADREVRQAGAVVLACSALRRAYRDRLRAAIGASVLFVLLDSSREELLARLNARSDHFMPAALLDSQLATLQRPQPGEAILSLTTRATPEQLCRTALDWITRQARLAG